LPIFFRSRGAHGLVEPVPIGVVRQHEAAIDAPAAAGAPHGHPAGGQSGGGLLEAPQPGRAQCGGRCDDQAAGACVAHIVDRGLLRSRQADALAAQHHIDRLDSAVGEDGPDALVEVLQQALSFAEGVGDQDGGLLLFFIRPPPIVDLLHHFRLRLPAEDR
ncbi:hypothetical protein RZS08_11665, partial [Arthrospira platensis SPKY1]|nr:hypothetical protein [Arthrospira platensis SPKY1]